MPDIFSQAFVGVRDGSITPANRADGRLVNAKRRTTLAQKPAGVAIAAGDAMFLGMCRAGERISLIRACTDTSLGTTTLDIGYRSSAGNLANRYVATGLLTTVNVPVILGPRASPLLSINAIDLEIWATFGVAGIASAVVLSFELDIVSQA